MNTTKQELPFTKPGKASCTSMRSPEQTLNASALPFSYAVSAGACNFVVAIPLYPRNIGSDSGKEGEEESRERERQTSLRAFSPSHSPSYTRMMASGPSIKDIHTKGGGRVGPKADIVVRKVAWI